MSERSRILVSNDDGFESEGIRALAAAMDFIDRSPAHGTTSMQRDLAAGRASELEQQTGAVVRFGRLEGVPVPVHRFLYACLLPAETLARRCVA